MEDLISRFPLVAQYIFIHLDIENLTSCRHVSKSFYASLENSKILWEKILNKYDENHIDKPLQVGL